MARALGLPSIEAAKRALQYWAGAGLLENERGGSPAPAAEPRHADLASMANDPYVAVLSQESQTIFGKGISRNELQRLVRKASAPAAALPHCPSATTIWATPPVPAVLVRTHCVYRHLAG